MVSSPGNHRGFTLVELLIGVVILSILVAIAAPAFNDALATQRLRAATNELRMSISHARSEAVKRNVTTDLVLVQRDSSWSNGWCIPEPGSGTTACADTSDGSGYLVGNYLNEVYLQEGVAVTEDSSSLTQIAFNNWGRTAGCPRFEFSTVSSGRTCALCLSATLDGRVVVQGGACPVTCPTSGEATNAWSGACP